MECQKYEKVDYYSESLKNCKKGILWATDIKSFGGVQNLR